MKSNRRIQYLAAFAVSLANMCNGASFFWITSTLPKFQNLEVIPNITNTEISWIVSVVVVGFLIGTIATIKISDKFGRRSTLTSSAFPYIVGTVSSVYLSEIADKEIRGTLTVITRIFFSIGVLLVLTIGAYVSYRVLTGILILFPVCYFLACLWIPESPYYLLKEGRVDAAKKVLLRLSGREDEKAIDEKLSLMRSDVRKEMARSGTLKELFTGKQYRRAIIASTGLRTFSLLTGVIPMEQYFGRIIQQSNCGLKVSSALAIFGVVRFVVGLISPLTVDRIGRRPLLISSYSIASIILAVVGFYFFMQQVIGISDESNNSFRYIVFIGITAVCSIANIGYNVLNFIIPAELFPLNVKSIAMTSIFIFISILHFIVVRAYQIMEDVAGLYGVIWFYSIMSVFGAVFSYFVIPETRGKSLREIQIELQGNIYDESNEKLNQVEVTSDYVLREKELTDVNKTTK